MPACKDKTNAMIRYIAYDEEIDIECDKFKDEVDFNAEIEKLKAENDDLFYKLNGVMWFVDKWLDGDELEQDELNRAITMREKTLQITEEQQKEIEKLKRAYSFLNKRYTDMMQKKIDVSVEELIQATTEGYKELAEELKRHCSDIDSDNINEPNVRILWDAEATIDYVVKELMGENK
jgi:hypothetical protein